MRRCAKICKAKKLSGRVAPLHPGWVLLLVGHGVVLGGCRHDKQRPNVLIITVDTLRADRVGCYGNAGGLTPNVDELAKDAIVFERGVAQVPLTLPSHTTILTGTYPFHNGVQDFTAQPLSDRFRTLAESLKDHGYATGAVVSSFVLDRSWGLARGFENYDDAFAGQEFLQKNISLVERRAEDSVNHAISWLESHRSRFSSGFIFMTRTVLTTRRNRFARDMRSSSTMAKSLTPTASWAGSFPGSRNPVTACTTIR
jgi:hypothetical protein